MIPHLQAIPLVLTYGGLAKDRRVSVEPISLKNSKKARLYYPQKSIKEKNPGIYFQHGMNHLGIDDQRITMLAESLAYSGFSVVIPELEDIKGLRFTLETIDDIEKLGKELTENKTWFDGKRFGYFSVSFSSGMGLVSFSRPSIADRIQSLMAVGTYCDFNDTYPFVFQNYKYDSYGVLILFYNYYDSLEPKIGKELKPVFFAAALDNANLRTGDDALYPKLLLKCSSVAQEVFQKLLNEESYRLEIGMAMKEKHPKSLIDSLSPANQIGSLQSPVSLLHGVADPVISPLEMQKLSMILKAKGHKFVARTSSALTHGDQLPLHTQILGVPALLETFGSFFQWLRN